MEGNENPWELISVSAFFLMETMNVFSQENYNPLFSCVITLYTLILIYLPHALKDSLSPVLILTTLLLLFLLRVGAIQRLQSPNPEINPRKGIIESKESKENRDNNINEAEKSGLRTQVDKWVEHHAEAGFDRIPKADFEESFVEWDVSAPLDVIYETHEGEEEDPNREYPVPDDNHCDWDPKRFATLDRYPSLSMYYPETDSDSSSENGFAMTREWNSPESIYSKWEEEDREGSLIEISLDGNKQEERGLGLGLGVHIEEDNFIEIDISPLKNDETFTGEL